MLFQFFKSFFLFVLILSLTFNVLLSCKNNTKEENITSNNPPIQNSRTITTDPVKEEIVKKINYFLDKYPDEIDAREQKEERKMGYQVHLTRPRSLVIINKMHNEGFKRIRNIDFSFSSYNGVFDRFKAPLENSATLFFENDSYQGRKVVIAIAVNNSGVKDREIKIN